MKNVEIILLRLLFIKLLYFMYSCLLRIEIIMCLVVGLFICLLRTVEIIMFDLSCMFAEN
jgi:hypothetical protein